MKKEGKIFGILQRVGRSFMLPIAILPVAGLLLGVGGSLTNETMIKAYGLEGILGNGTLLHAVFDIMKAAGDVVFANLPLIFAIGVAIGMAKAEKAVAALAGTIAFFIMHSSIGAMIEITGGSKNLMDGASAQVLGITSLQMGVFGGIIVGLGVAALHNRFYKQKLPAVLSFFEGTRFVPIISALVYVIVGMAMFYIWPFVQVGINGVGKVVQESGYAGTWVYGFMERLLIPFGLHHVFYLPFWQTSVGGSMTVAGHLVEGAQNIFFAQLNDPSVSHFAVSATRFMSGKFPLMIFGLPGAALAMYRVAKPENRKAVGGLLISAALTSMLTGITEPIEFTFLFVAPVLYGIHCVFAGCAYMLMHIFNVGVGMTFSGGFIDMFLFGILQTNAKTSWYNIVFVGIVYFVVYYFLFSFLIKKFNFNTPGRGDEEEIKLYTKLDLKNKSAANQMSIGIIKGLGGRKNIVDVDSCATRLRCTVADSSLVNEEILKITGAHGIITSGNGVQVIYGPRVSVIKSELDEYLPLYSDSDVFEAMANVEGAKPSEEKEIKKDVVEFHIPFKGKLLNLESVEDEVFSQKMMGEGFAMDVENGELHSPIDGTVAMVFDTKHAVIVVDDKDNEILIHMGMDTVKLNGEGFEVFVKVGDKVKAMDKLAKMDVDFVKSKGLSTLTPIVFTNYTGTISVDEGEVVEVGTKDKVKFN